MIPLRELIRAIRTRRAARWALRFFCGIVLISLFGDFLANEKPLYCKLEGRTYFPVVQDYAVRLGWMQWESRFLQEGWYDQPFEKALFPPIPYSAGTVDRRNLGAKSPFGPQRTDARRRWHWLGTDMAGHDVAAGLIYGARVALIIGLIGMLTATLLGVFFGGLSGYYGNDRFRTRRSRIGSVLLGSILGLYWLWAHFSGLPAERTNWVDSLVIPAGLTALATLVAVGCYAICQLLPWGRKTIAVPFDFWITRLIEVLNAVPALLLILALLAAMKKPSIYAIMIIIGMVRWTGIARLVRAELLKVRAMPYIEASRALGYSSWRILFRHALPNSLGPVWVTLAFGMAGAILIEASLSFLGIGLPVETVTWGSLMRQASGVNLRPWWLAVFPGMAIFFTILALNILGETLNDALAPRRGTGI